MSKMPPRNELGFGFGSYNSKGFSMKVTEILLAYKKGLREKRRDHLTAEELEARVQRVERLAKLREEREPLELPLT
jgi:hypothetical protein